MLETGRQIGQHLCKEKKRHHFRLKLLHQVKCQRARRRNPSSCCNSPLHSHSSLYFPHGQQKPCNYFQLIYQTALHLLSGYIAVFGTPYWIQHVQIPCFLSGYQNGPVLLLLPIYSSIYFPFTAAACSFGHSNILLLVSVLWNSSDVHFSALMCFYL